MKTLILGLAVTALAWAAPGDHDRRDRYRSNHNDYDGYYEGAYRIPQRDVIVVRDHYRGNRLPPGLSRKFARGGALPRGWQRRVRPVPVVIERRLAPLPYGYRRGIYDGAYIVYDSRRGILADFFFSF